MVLCEKAKKKPRVEVFRIDADHRKSRDNAIGRPAIAGLSLRALPLAAIAIGHSSGATFEERYNLAATREMTDCMKSGSMAGA
jgi:hypothetical protein